VVAVDSPEGRRRVEIVHAMAGALSRRDVGSIEHHFHPEVQVVLREGTVRGFQYVERFFASQLEQFGEIRVDVDDIHEAADGTLIACLTVDRRSHEGEPAMRVWPGQVFRFDEADRVTFYEGYPRQDDALDAHGIERHDRPERASEHLGNAIQVRALEREFPGGIKAVDGIDLDVDEGEIYAFLGPNGAGKTTTVRMLVTLLRPTGGTAAVAGHDVVKEPQQVRRAIGVALQEAALDPLMTGSELMELQATLHGIPRDEAQVRAKRLLDRVGLSDAADRRVGTYSGGMRRRLDLGMALVHDPKVLFLDEPTTGLDPQSRRAIWDEVRRLNDEGTTVFLTTQYLEEADQLADRVGIINNGRMAAEGTPEALKASMGRSYLELAVSGNGGGSPADVLGRFGEVMPGDNGTLRVALQSGAADIAPIVRALDEAGMTVESLRLVEPTLDDVFLATTGEHLEGQETEQEDA
jgi:ABC-2 type transport system ATP-binding protein